MLVKEKSDIEEERNIEEIEERFENNECAKLFEQSDVENEHDNEQVSYYLHLLLFYSRLTLDM